MTRKPTGKSLQGIDTYLVSLPWLCSTAAFRAGIRDYRAGKPLSASWDNVRIRPSPKATYHLDGAVIYERGRLLAARWPDAKPNDPKTKLAALVASADRDIMY